jgi:hypothetical protein
MLSPMTLIDGFHCIPADVTFLQSIEEESAFVFPPEKDYSSPPCPYCLRFPGNSSLIFPIVLQVFETPDTHSVMRKKQNGKHKWLLLLMAVLHAWTLESLLIWTHCILYMHG